MVGPHNCSMVYNFSEMSLYHKPNVIIPTLFLPKPEDSYEDYYEDQKNEELNEHGKDLSNSNEDLLLTFQSGFMPTPPQRKKSNKNKTVSIDSEGKITRICKYKRWT